MEQHSAKALIIKQYVHNDHFREEIENIRIQYGIPKDGFKEPEAYRLWLKRMGGEKFTDTIGSFREYEKTDYYKYARDIDRVALRCIPRELFIAFEKFIAYPAVPIEPWPPVYFDDDQFDFCVHLVIRPFATRAEIIRFIQRNYQSIRSRLLENRNVKMKRAPKLVDTDLLLLADHYRRQGKTWDETATILRKQHGYKDLFFDKLKELWQRSKNSIRNVGS